jgi:CspA family cold shock protein
MQRGTVKWFDAEKGYGFIAPHSGSEDVFVHGSNVASLEYGESLDEGDTVEFEVERTPKGLSARNVQRAGDLDVDETL